MDASLKRPSRLRGPAALAAFISLAATGFSRADQTVDITTVPGTDNDDVIVVLTQQDADALIASIIAEISKAVAAKDRL